MTAPLDTMVATGSGKSNPSTPSPTFQKTEARKRRARAEGVQKIEPFRFGRYTFRGKNCRLLFQTRVNNILHGNVDSFTSLSGFERVEGSPCIGAGRPIPENGGLDFWGNLLPLAMDPSIGVHEPPVG